MDLTDLKNISFQTVQPRTKRSHACTLMLLTNLAEPEWVSIRCDEKLLQVFVCAKREFGHNAKTQVLHKTPAVGHVCPSAEVRIHGRCVLLIWYSLSAHETFQKLDTHSEVNVVRKELRTLIQSLFWVTSKSLLFPHETRTELLYQISSQKYLRSFQYTLTTVNRTRANGFILSMSNTRKLVKEQNIFQCVRGGYVSALHVCDELRDCPWESSDEDLCVHETADTEENTGKSNLTCPSLFFTTHSGLCLKFLSVSESTRQQILPERKTFMCDNSVKVDTAFLNDLVVDCGPMAEDEPLLLTLLKDTVFKQCTEPFEEQCLSGHPRCYNISDVCNYKLNPLGKVVPCRNGAHLQLCEKFECNINLKCPLSYCIPWIYICDGKWDCPHGEEERQGSVCGKSEQCVGRFLFKCKVGRCIHLAELCDQKVDCPLGDDEMLCFLASKPCPLACRCLLYAAACKDVAVVIDKNLFHYVSLMIENVIVVNLPNIKNANASFVSLRNNRIKQICNVTFPPVIVHLDCKLNLLQTLSHQCFGSLSLLRSIVLTDNRISHIQMSSFANLTRLKLLDLSSNPLRKLPKHFLKGSHALRFLSIAHVVLSETDYDALDSFLGTFVNTTDYLVCCLAASQLNCSATIPWYSSCASVLKEKSMRIVFLSVSGLLLSTNLFSILIHIFNKEIKRAFAAAVVAVNLTHVLLAIFLALIGAADIVYDRRSITKQHIWRSHTVCFVAFQCLICFTLLIQVCLIFLCLSRLMVVIEPFDSVFKETRFAVKTLTYLVILSCVASTMITVTSSAVSSVLPTSLCLPFWDPTHSSIPIKFATWFTAISQALTACVVAVVHTSLLHFIQTSQKSIRSSKTESKSSHIAVQLSVLTVCNFLCWFPVNTFCVVAMFISSYPPELLTWMIATVLPLNSLVHPAVFVRVSFRTCCESKSSDKTQNDKRGLS